jgi:hypothetical protein
LLLADEHMLAGLQILLNRVRRITERGAAEIRALQAYTTGVFHARLEQWLTMRIRGTLSFIVRSHAHSGAAVLCTPAQARATRWTRSAS